MSKSKHDFTRHMRNTNLSEIERGTSGRANREVRSGFHGAALEIVPSDKNRLEHFFKQELAYYNALVEGFSSRIRAFPESIVEFDDAWQKIFALCAQRGKGLRDISKKIEPLPDSMSPYQKQIFGNDDNGKPLLTERRLMYMDIAASPATLLPEVRFGMALDMVKFFRLQAQRAIEPVAKSQDVFVEDDVYKTAPEILQVADLDRKRHLQIPKRCLTLKWNEDTETTLIACPYVAKPMELRGINLSAATNWTHIVIRQNADKFIKPDSPWVVDIKKMDGNYDLKLLDNNGHFRSRAFEVAKRKAHT